MGYKSERGEYKTMTRTLLSYFSPARTFLLSLFLTIIIGTFLLALPISQKASISAIPFIDLFFTATSAICVTGLFTIPLEHFTPFGLSIILLLIQIGGIGIITMSLFVMALFVNFGISTEIMASHILELESWKNSKRLVIFIIIFTLIVELLGAFYIASILIGKIPSIQPQYAFFLSLFHTISSYCNAGISISPDLLQLPVIKSQLLIATTILMFIGGFGFVTWLEILRYIQQKIINKKPYRFSLQTKIIMRASLSLFALSALLFWFLEKNHLFANMSHTQTFLQTLFHAVSFRGTGFLLPNIALLQPATLLLTLILGFIGASPESTGSGIKITTIAIIFATIRSVFLGKKSVNILERQIPYDQVLKAIAIMSCALCWITFTLFCLSITEKNQTFFALFYETYAAFTNLGISTGITPQLSFWGKLLIMLSMFIGRIGSVGFILALKFRKTERSNTFLYPEERIMLG